MTLRLFKVLATGLTVSVMAATPTLAQSEDQLITQISPSIIMIGTPDPCDNGGCEEELAVIEAKGDGNAALIDAYGMPTSMPVIMRPSVDTSVGAAASAPANPAAQAAPAQAAEPAPVAGGEAAPAPLEAPAAIDAPNNQS